MPGIAESLARGRAQSMEMFSRLYELRSQLEEQRREKLERRMKALRDYLENGQNWATNLGANPANLQAFQSELNDIETRLQLPPSPFLDPRKKNLRVLLAEHAIKWQTGLSQGEFANKEEAAASYARSALAIANVAYYGDTEALTKDLWQQWIEEQSLRQPPQAEPEKKEAIAPSAGVVPEAATKPALLGERPLPGPLEYFQEKGRLLAPPETRSQLFSRIKDMETDLGRYVRGAKFNNIELQAMLRELEEAYKKGGIYRTPDQILLGAIPTSQEYETLYASAMNLAKGGAVDPDAIATLARYSLLRSGEEITPENEQARAAEIEESIMGVARRSQLIGGVLMQLRREATLAAQHPSNAGLTMAEIAGRKYTYRIDEIVPRWLGQDGRLTTEEERNVREELMAWAKALDLPATEEEAAAAKKRAEQRDEDRLRISLENLGLSKEANRRAWLTFYDTQEAKKKSAAGGTMTPAQKVAAIRYVNQYWAAANSRDGVGKAPLTQGQWGDLGRDEKNFEAETAAVYYDWLETTGNLPPGMRRPTTQRYGKGPVGGSGTRKTAEEARGQVGIP